MYRCFDKAKSRGMYRKLRKILIKPAVKYGYGEWIWSGTEEKQKLHKRDFMNP
jgi:hypothetical protein